MSIDKSDMNLPVYTSGSFWYEDTFYFSSMNSSWLFKWDKNTNLVEKVIKLPVSTNNCQRFSGIVVYEHTAWFIPWYEKEIIAFNIIEREITVYEVSFVANKEDILFRMPVRDGKFIWLLPLKDKALYRVDMANKVVRKYNDFPQDVTWGDGKMNFNSMCLSGDNIYLFASTCSHNLVFNIKKEVFEKSVNQDDIFFAVVLNNGKIVRGPIYDKWGFRVYKGNGEIISEQQTSNEMFCETKYYSYWISKKIGDYVVILPHEANGIFFYNTISEEVEYFNIDSPNYKSSRECKRFSGFDVDMIKEKYYISSYQGNAVLEIDVENRKYNVQYLYIEDDGDAAISYDMLHGNFIDEANYSLTDYINSLFIKNDIFVLEENK